MEMKTGNLPKLLYSVMIVPIPEYKINIDILRRLTLNLSDSQYQFGVKPCISTRPVTVSKVKMPPEQILAATKLVTMRQYRILGGHEEISQAIRNLLDVEVLRWQSDVACQEK